MGEPLTIARVALAWCAQRIARRVNAITRIHAVVDPRSERWCLDGEEFALLDSAYGPERLYVQTVERVGPVVLVRERLSDVPCMLYVLRADREVSGDVAASLRREADHG